MATISENLQIIKDSTTAIKQAIIDKGGSVSGDITTWANAISGISGGNTDEEITFTGVVTYNTSTITLTGLLSSKPELSPLYLILLYLGSGEIITNRKYISNIDISDVLDISVNTQEPLSGNEIPTICLMHPISGKIFPVRFIRSSMSGGSPN